MWDFPSSPPFLKSLIAILSISPPLKAGFQISIIDGVVKEFLV
jgi:hypothetical protein